jgi:hypothetical protein
MAEIRKKNTPVLAIKSRRMSRSVSIARQLSYTYNDTRGKVLRTDVQEKGGEEKSEN